MHFLERTHLFCFDTIDSTHREAERLVRHGVTGEFVVWALSQTAGRGRLERPWVSPPGNLYCTVRIQRHFHSSGLLSLLGGVALQHWLSMLVPSSVALQCKWPNDLYANGGKLAGLLIQTIPMVEGGSPSFLVSLGLNGEKAPKTGDYPTASLASLGVQSLSPERLLEGWMEALEHGIADWQTYGNEWLRDRWMSVAWGCGHVITMQQGNQRISGKMRGITDEGALELQLADGTTCLMHSGHMIREDRLLPQPNDEGLL